MIELAQAAALVLAVVFAWAAVAKVRDRPATVDSFRGLGLPAPTVLASVVPAVELVLAAGLVAVPRLASFAALALVLAFSAVIGRAVAVGSSAGCACFGGSPGDRPVSILELVRNGGLGALAVVASGAGPGSALWPDLRSVVIVTVLVALSRVAFAVVEHRRVGAGPT